MPEKDLIQRFTIGKKISLLVESWNLEGENLGRFLRKNGISSPEILAWQECMHEGFEEGKPMARNTKKALENRIKLLEEEVRQLSLLNEIQKKVQNVLTEHEEKNTKADSDPKSLGSSKTASKKG
jgi:hypothetical protein